METTYKGINYGSFDSNLDKATGIRYGVINQGAIGEAWYEDSEPFYGEPSCPECGSSIEFDDEVTLCQCGFHVNMDEAYPEDPISWYFEDSEYSAESDDYGDIFITKSPYFTHAQFCSPCAPGAVHLENPLSEPDENQKGYCFGHDWFESEVAPYPVYSVETGKLI